MVGKKKNIAHYQGLRDDMIIFCSRECVFLIIFILFCNLCCETCTAQNEIQISHAGSLPTVVNPGATGSSGSYKAIAAYRSQWVGFEDAPSTTVIGVDGEVKFLKNFHGVGATVIVDEIGAFTNMNVNLNYSYHLELNDGLLGLGMRVGAINVAMKNSDLRPSVDGMEDDYHQSDDMALQGDDDSATGLDIGLGVFYQTQRGYLSFSILHVNAPKVEMKSGTKIGLRPVMTIGGGRQYKWGAEMIFEPRCHIKTDFSTIQTDITGSLNFKKVASLGLGYRLQDAIFFQLGANLSNGLFVGYTYEIGVSKLSSYNSGTHEIALGYTFNIDIEKRTKRYKSVRLL